MATPLAVTSSPDLKEMHRSADASKGIRSPIRSKSASSVKHRTRFPADSLRESEKSLHKLLEDFEEGKLNAFGNSDMLQQLNEIREMQEHLTMRHFEIDQMRINKDGSESYQDEASIHELTQTLEKLGTAIQSLHAGTGLDETISGSTASSASSAPPTGTPSQTSTV